MSNRTNEDEWKHIANNEILESFKNYINKDNTNYIIANFADILKIKLNHEMIKVFVRQEFENEIDNLFEFMRNNQDGLCKILQDKLEEDKKEVYQCYAKNSLEDNISMNSWNDRIENSNKNQDIIRGEGFNNNNSIISDKMNSINNIINEDNNITNKRFKVLDNDYKINDFNIANKNNIVDEDNINDEDNNIINKSCNIVNGDNIIVDEDNIIVNENNNTVNENNIIVIENNNIANKSFNIVNEDGNIDGKNNIKHQKTEIIENNNDPQIIDDLIDNFIKENLLSKIFEMKYKIKILNSIFLENGKLHRFKDRKLTCAEFSFNRLFYAKIKKNIDVLCNFTKNLLYFTNKNIEIFINIFKIFGIKQKLLSNSRDFLIEMVSRVLKDQSHKEAYMYFRMTERSYLKKFYNKVKEMALLKLFIPIDMLFFTSEIEKSNVGTDIFKEDANEFMNYNLKQLNLNDLFKKLVYIFKLFPENLRNEFLYNPYKSFLNKLNDFRKIYSFYLFNFKILEFFQNEEVERFYFSIFENFLEAEKNRVFLSKILDLILNGLLNEGIKLSTCNNFRTSINSGSRVNNLLMSETIHISKENLRTNINDISNNDISDKDINNRDINDKYIINDDLSSNDISNRDLDNLKNNNANDNLNNTSIIDTNSLKDLIEPNNLNIIFNILRILSLKSKSLDSFHQLLQRSLSLRLLKNNILENEVIVNNLIRSNNCKTMIDDYKNRTNVLLMRKGKWPIFNDLELKKKHFDERLLDFKRNLDMDFKTSGKNIKWMDSLSKVKISIFGNELEISLFQYEIVCKIVKEGKWYIMNNIRRWCVERDHLNVPEIYNNQFKAMIGSILTFKHGFFYIDISKNKNPLDFRIEFENERFEVLDETYNLKASWMANISKIMKRSKKIEVNLLREMVGIGNDEFINVLKELEEKEIIETKEGVINYIP